MGSGIEFAVTEGLRRIMTVYLLLAVARAFLQYSNADFYNPVSRFINTATVFPIRVFRIFMPRVGGKDLLSPAALVVASAILEQFLEYQLTSAFDMAVLGLARSVEVCGDFLVFAILIHVVLSWVAPRKVFTLALLVNSISNLVLAPIRRFLPPMGGLDFSPIVALLGISVITSTIYNSLARLIS